MENSKTAVIFGVTGQDGCHLSDFLLHKDYNVVGVARRSSTDNTIRLEEIKDHENFKLVEGDVLDPSSINSTIHEHEPDEVYNLAAQSHVGTSFEQPSLTFQTNAIGVLNILETIRTTKPDTKFYQASTSEIFGNNYSLDSQKTKFQDEQTPFAPCSPYAVAKEAAHRLVFTYRESYGLHASAGILFNHEGPNRGEKFVTRKITKYVGSLVHRSWNEMGHTEKIYDVLQPDEVDPLLLGNLDTRRDWGYAGDYVRAMWLMLQQDKPDDYVISTGKTHSIRQFLSAAFGYIGIDWDDYVKIDQRFYRPADVDLLCGCSDKAKKVLGWKPKVDFEELVKKMVEHDIQEAKNETSHPVSVR